MTAMLEIDDLEIDFGGVRALDGVSWAVNAPSIASIVGPNGAGKTTLLNTICGVLEPNRGTIRIGGTATHGLRPDQIAALGVARSFQHPQVRPEASVVENIALGRHLKSVSWLTPLRKLEQSTVVSDSLALVGLSDRQHARAGELSYAELKKVDLARALALEPRLLLLDEPFSGLADSDREALCQTLRTLVKRNLTVVMIEHTPSLVMALSDQILVLDHGSVVAAGSPTALSSNPEVGRVYPLGAP